MSQNDLLAKVTLLHKQLVFRSEIVHVATYELVTPIEGGDPDYGRGGYVDTWYRSNHLHPFDEQGDESHDPPTAIGQRVTFALQLALPRYPLSWCYAGGGCPYHHAPDSYFCSQHASDFRDRSQEEIGAIVLHRLESLTSRLEAELFGTLEPPKGVEVSYIRQDDDGSQAKTVAKLKRVEWVVSL